MENHIFKRRHFELTFMERITRLFPGLFCERYPHLQTTCLVRPLIILVEIFEYPNTLLLQLPNPSYNCNYTSVIPVNWNDFQAIIWMFASPNIKVFSPIWLDTLTQFAASIFTRNCQYKLHEGALPYIRGNFALTVIVYACAVCLFEKYADWIALIGIKNVPRAEGTLFINFVQIRWLFW